MSGQKPVEDRLVLNDSKAGSTPAQDAQIRAYAQGCDQAHCAGALSPTGRASTAGRLRSEATEAAKLELATNPAPYVGKVVGHVPDTTWTGQPNSRSWLPLDNSINSSLGAQAQRYPIGYKPTGFWFIDDYIAQFGGPPPL